MLRFSIRDVLWLTVVAGVAFGWWREHRQTVAIQVARLESDRRLQDLAKEIKREGYFIYRTYGSNGFQLLQDRSRPSPDLAGVDSYEIMRGLLSNAELVILGEV